MAEHNTSWDAAREPAAAQAAGWPGPRSATAVGPVPPSGGLSAPDRHQRRRSLIAGLIGAVVATLLSLIFISSFIGALHDPRPRSTPVGIVGPPAAATVLGRDLDHAVPARAGVPLTWAGGAGVVVIALLFIPVGIASSGVTLGPNMITPWYADLGRALPPGAALPAVLNTTYFHGNAITTPLLVLSAWALAGILAMVMASILHPPVPGQRHQPQPAGEAAAPRPAARHRATT